MPSPRHLDVDLGGKSLRVADLNAATAGARSGFASLPGNVNLLGEGDSSIIVGELAVSAGVAGRERDAVVDVKETGGAAGRPDNSRGLDLVVLSVNLTIGECTTATDGHAGGRSRCGILREEIGCQESASDALVQPGPSVVGSVHNCVLEASRVLQVQVKLAGFGPVGLLGARAIVGLELIETECDDSLVGRRAVGNGTLWTSISRIRVINDGDQRWVNSVSPRNRIRQSEDGEEEGSNFGEHFEC